MNEKNKNNIFWVNQREDTICNYCYEKMSEKERTIHSWVKEYKNEAYVCPRCQRKFIPTDN